LWSLNLSAVEVSELEQWVIREGLAERPVEEIMGDFCRRLRAAGFPIIRFSIATNMVHSIYRGFSYTWLAENDVVDEGVFLRENMNEQFTDDFKNSPFFYMATNRQPEFRQNFTEPVVREFEVYDMFRGMGATDYFVSAVGFEAAGGPNRPAKGLDLNGALFSWLGDGPGGWSEEEIASIRRLTTAMALVAKTRASQLTAISVAETYLGRDAGRRVMAGKIDRGSFDTISAVIFFADLRGFTKLADQMEPPALVSMLDDYLEAITKPVVDGGGEVLKFMGDGVLAVFEIDTGDTGYLCERALRAAREAVDGMAELNAARREDGSPCLDLDIALHVGDVLYGNVGAVGRLDFTVIGPAVNEASRLEVLCEPLDQNLIISEEFARQANHCTDKLIPVGAHELRGLPGKRQVYTVDPEL
jgi:adenylate cyclase